MDNSELGARLKAIEAQLGEALARIGQLENQRGDEEQTIREVAVAPPPVLYGPAPEPEQEPVPAPVAAPEMPPEPIRYFEQPPVVAKNPDELEYKFGINGLLRGGAVVIVCAFLFLVGLMISRGYLTRQIQFGGEIALCVLFVGLGLWKRDEREDFGQLMTGIGSFGLYASFAGGFAYKDLYGGSTLTALYVGLSALNLVFSLWRSSKSFLAIGLLGGLTAAMIPLQKQGYDLSLGLHFSILLACTTLILKNRWFLLAPLMWLASSAALAPVVLSSYDDLIKVTAIFLSALLCIFAYGKPFEENEFDAGGWFIPVMLWPAGVVGLAISVQKWGWMPTAAYGLGGTLVTLALRGSAVPYRMMAWTTAFTISTLLPATFQRVEAVVGYGVLTLLWSLGARRWSLNGAQWMASLMFALAVLVYSAPVQPTVYSLLANAPMGEAGLLILLSAGAIALMHSAYVGASDNFAEFRLFAGSCALAGFAIRATKMAFSTGPSPLLRVEDSAAMAFSVCAVAVVWAATRLKRDGLVFAAVLAALVQLGMALLREPEVTPHWLTVVLLFLGALSVAISGVEIARRSPIAVLTVVVVGGAVLSALFLRLTQIAGHFGVLGLDATSVVFLALAGLSVVWTALAVARKLPALFVLAWLAMIFTGGGGLAMTQTGLPIWFNPTILAVPLLVSVVLYAKTPSGDIGEGGVATGFVIALWSLGAVLIQRELVRESIGLTEIAAMTVGWVVVAVVLIVAGFVYDRRHLRYGSLLVFAATVGKVFAVDLSSLDSMVRVAMLLLLGLGMVGGGYWYILWRRRSPEVTP